MLFALSTLASCTVLGPDYEEPEVDWLREWQPSVYGLSDANPDDDKRQAKKKQIDTQFWWHLFKDPILNSRLIDEARQENHSLRIGGQAEVIGFTEGHDFLNALAKIYIRIMSWFSYAY